MSGAILHCERDMRLSWKYDVLRSCEGRGWGWDNCLGKSGGSAAGHRAR